MADPDPVAQLMKGVDAWNLWRSENPDVEPDLVGASLSGADLSGVDLNGVDLSAADLSGTDLCRTNLRRANLDEANLGRAFLGGAFLGGANLRRASLREAKLSGADLRGADLRRADLSGADLRAADLRGTDLYRTNFGRANLREAKLGGAFLGGAFLGGANLRRANLREANLGGADLSKANLREANLGGASLTHATLVHADLRGAELTGCHIYGVSAWDLRLKGAKQENLIITPEGAPEVTVDNLEVGQFVYLLLHNEKIRDVIDTFGKKGVLLLGRFTHERKAILDALREELRKHDYLPILLDFDVPASRDITETVSLLARMARFIIVEMTDPSSIPKELEAIVPHLAVPVQPLLEGASRPFAMFKDYWKYDWVLQPHRYEGLETLLTTIAENVIAPAEAKVNALQERRRLIEAELMKPR
jgi:uncharacterized protein YjbI with pentapeptide repeats